jgi:hypothetical protein
MHARRLGELAMRVGGGVLNPSLTVVLPVHNGEARLRGCVGEILELASELTTRFDVLIIDDGSTDDTFAAAEELSARFPQVSVRRNRHQRGLGPALEAATSRVRSDVVIVHDGVSPIDADQLRKLWRQRVARGQAVCGSREGATETGAGTLAGAAAVHEALVRAHDRVLGFQLLPSRPIDASQPEWSPAHRLPRRDVAHSSARGGIGEIPPLPRPKFLSALAAFALGE